MTGELKKRIGALGDAVHAARGRLPEDVLDRTEKVVELAEERMRIGGRNTVVALGGATGSGKSSLFNAFSRIDLAGVGVRRPMTSWTLACTWGGDEALELLEWIGIPPRHHLTRSGPLEDLSGDDAMLDGLVLLDMPDHDSVFDAHHNEVDRVVKFADLFVWVLDPQKYADAALHDNYLNPMGRSRENMLVVLNQIDRLSPDEREVVLADLRQLLDSEGLAGVPIVGTSARTGEGLDELRSLVGERVRENKAASRRTDVNVAIAVEELSQLAGGAHPAGVTDEARREFSEEVAKICEVDRLVDAVESDALRRGRAATRWLPWGRSAARHQVPSPEVAAVGSVARLGVASRDFAATCFGGLPTRWQLEAHRSIDAVDTLPTALSERLAEVELPLGVHRGWWSGYRAFQAVLLLAFLGFGVLAGLLYADVIGFALPSLSVETWIVAASVSGGALLLTLVNFAFARGKASRQARELSKETRGRLLERISEVLAEEIEVRVKRELHLFETFHTALIAAANPEPDSVQVEEPSLS